MSPDDPSLVGPILLQVVLILLNAFFAMTEIAVISLNDNAVRHQAQSGDKRARRILPLIDHPSRFLATIQVGITLAGFLGSAFAAENFSDILVNWLVGLGVTLSPVTLDRIMIVVITLILSYFTLVFGELVPKRLAMQKADAISRMVAPIINALAFVLTPVVKLLTGSTNLVSRLFGVKDTAAQEQVTEEEIRMLLEQGEEMGNIQQDEMEMIENVFEFNNKTAEDVMTHRTQMCAISVGAEDPEIYDTIDEGGYSRYIVYGKDPDDVLGVLYSRDFLMDRIRGSHTPLRELVRPAYFVPESVPTDRLFADMRQRKVHISVVLDEYGGVSGIVTLEDLLEEIVGNIYDEFDQAEEDISMVEPGVWRMRGATELETVEELLDVDIDCDQDTLSGLVTSQLQEIPDHAKGFKIKACGLMLEVESVENHRVEWVKVSALPKEEADRDE